MPVTGTEEEPDTGLVCHVLSYVRKGVTVGAAAFCPPFAITDRGGGVPTLSAKLHAQHMYSQHSCNRFWVWKLRTFVRLFYHSCNCNTREGTRNSSREGFYSSGMAAEAPKRYYWGDRKLRKGGLKTEENICIQRELPVMSRVVTFEQLTN